MNNASNASIQPNTTTISEYELNTILTALWLMHMDSKEELAEQFHSLYLKLQAVQVDYKRPGLFTIQQEDAQ